MQFITTNHLTPIQYTYICNELISGDISARAFYQSSSSFLSCVIQDEYSIFDSSSYYSTNFCPNEWFWVVVGDMDKIFNHRICNFVLQYQYVIEYILTENQWNICLSEGNALQIKNYHLTAVHLNSELSVQYFGFTVCNFTVLIGVAASSRLVNQ